MTSLQRCHKEKLSALGREPSMAAAHWREHSRRGRTATASKTGEHQQDVAGRGSVLQLQQVNGRIQQQACRRGLKGTGKHTRDRVGGLAPLLREDSSCQPIAATVAGPGPAGQLVTSAVCAATGV